jgi:D-3-phosphoglycerate dehydrogenase
MDMVPEGQMVVILNNDQPGVIGTVGTTFGDAGINIADMVISREKHADGTATALMVLKTDSAPTDATLNKLRDHKGIVKIKSIVLPARGA